MCSTKQRRPAFSQLEREYALARSSCVLLLLITLFDRILLTVYGRQRQSIAPA